MPKWDPESLDETKATVDNGIPIRKASVTYQTLNRKANSLSYDFIGSATTLSRTSENLFGYMADIGFELSKTLNYNND